MHIHGNWKSRLMRIPAIPLSSGTAPEAHSILESVLLPSSSGRVSQVVLACSTGTRLTLLLLALSGWALANPTTGAGQIGG